MRTKIDRPLHERGARILLLPFSHWRQLDVWRKLALIGCVTITFGTLLSIPDFGWIEAAQLLVAVSCMRLLARYVESHPFSTPFADGTLFVVGAVWTILIAVGNTLLDSASPRSELIVLGGCMALLISGMIIRIEEGREWYEHDHFA